MCPGGFPAYGDAVTNEDSAALEAFFSMEGDSYVPGPMAQGPWGPVMGGQIVGGLLGWAIERGGIDPGFQPARLTVDLLRPVPLEPVQIRTSVVRDGRRIKLIDAAMLQDDKVVARASALFLRRGEHPDVRVWSAPVPMPALAPNADGFPADIPFRIWSYSADLVKGSPGMAEWEQAESQKFAWTQLFRPMVHGHPLTPFVRLAFVGDITSSLANWGEGGLRFINADYTITATRLPDGEFVGLAAQSHYGIEGVATCSAALFDRHGPFGTAVAVALAQPADAFMPSSF